MIDQVLGYAAAGRRAQRSQAGAFVVSIVNAPNMDPSWLYSAVTEAEEVAAIIVGEKPALVVV